MEKKDLGRLVAPFVQGRLKQTERSWRTEDISRKQRISPDDYDLKTVFLPMTDATELAIDIITPRNASPPFYTVFHQTRYGRSVRLKKPWRYAVQKGNPIDLVNGPLKRAFTNENYAVVSLDVRGTGASFGRWHTAWCEQERLDSLEVLEWICKQEWSNGKVGLFGMSYDGAAALRTLSSKHPAITCCVATYPFFDIYSGISFPGGVPLRSFLEDWSTVNRNLDNNDFEEMSCLLGCLVRGMSKPNNLVRKESGHLEKIGRGERRSRLLRAVAGHELNYDCGKDIATLRSCDDRSPTVNSTILDTSTTRDAAKILDQSTGSAAPLLAISGWLDATARDAICAYDLFQKSGGAGSELVIGPWTHGGLQNVRLAQNENTTIGEYDLVGEIVHFFRKHMSEQKAEKAETPVHYYTIGMGKWQGVSQWPPSNQTKKVLYFGSQGEMSDSPAEEESKVEHKVDLSVRPSGKSRWNAMIKQLQFVDYKGISASAGFLCFFGEPLEADLEITGSAIAETYVESSDGAADVFAYLLDGDESGGEKHAYVTEGHFRSLHRKEKPEDCEDVQRWQALIPQSPAIPLPRHTFRAADVLEELEPAGQPTKLSFALFPTSYLFKKGHRIGLAISGADTAHFGIDEKLAAGGKRTLTFRCGGPTPSALHLPVVN